MSSTFDRAIQNVVNTTIESCVRIVKGSKGHPADSHDQLRELIVQNLELLKLGLNEDIVKLPQ